MFTKNQLKNGLAVVGVIALAPVIIKVAMITTMVVGAITIIEVVIETKKKLEDKQEQTSEKSE